MRASDISPEFPLLGFLSQASSHGYELHRRLEEELQGIWSLSQSQVYNLLKRLEAQGDVQGEVQQQKAAPAKRLLALTPAGRKRFERWLREPTPGSVRAVRIEFLTRLYFARTQDAQFTQDLIDDQKRSITLDVQRLQQIYSEIPGSQLLNQLSLQLRTRQLKSCLAWLEDCRSSLEI
ncbi:PadR family transcriptional regulator [Chloroflexota bacterium]